MLRLNVCDSNMLTDCFRRVLVDAIFFTENEVVNTFFFGCCGRLPPSCKGRGTWAGMVKGEGGKGEKGRRWAQGEKGHYER